jgi:hypothetical protein
MQMLLRDRQTATLADALQAERWHHWLLHERSALTIELSKQASHYQRCAASVSDRRLHYLRRSIRSTENEIKTIDRMIDSLTRRFPDVMSTLR